MQNQSLKFWVRKIRSCLHEMWREIMDKEKNKKPKALTIRKYDTCQEKI